MFNIKAEPLGEVKKTDKGFLRQFLVVTDKGKDVIKVFSKKAEDLAGAGPRNLCIRQDFFFVA
jgi:hypothetical protein